MDRRAEVLELAAELVKAVDGWLVWDPVAVARYLRKVRCRLNRLVELVERGDKSENVADGEGGRG
jgi:hypothetical protein